MLRLIARVLLWSVLGFLLGAVLVIIVSTLAVPILGISQMEGGYAMGIVFFWVPLGAVIGALIGGIRAALRGRS